MNTQNMNSYMSSNMNKRNTAIRVFAKYGDKGVPDP